MKYSGFVHRLAEHAEWDGWWPHRFWLWLLKRSDRKAGYELEYDE